MNQQRLIEVLRNEPKTHEEYLARSHQSYLSRVESLLRKMNENGILQTDSSFDNNNFTIYSSGNAEIPTRDQPFLTRMGYGQRRTKRVNLKDIGEILHHLIGAKEKYKETPKSLDEIASVDLSGLCSMITVTEEKL
mgnify:CR=1 FL=1